MEDFDILAKPYESLEYTVFKKKPYLRPKILPAEREIYELDSLKRRKISHKTYQKLKYMHIACKISDIKYGFLSGFVAYCICLNCRNIVDHWPCFNKKVFWVPKEHCGFCMMRLPVITQEEVNALQDMPKRKHKGKFEHWEIT